MTQGNFDDFDNENRSINNNSKQENPIPVLENKSNLSTIYQNWKWSKNKVITPNSQNSSYYADVVIDTKDNLHVVWEDSTDFNGTGNDYDIYYKMYSQKTSKWSTPKLISTNSNLESDNAAIAIDELNNLHVVWEDQTNFFGSGADSDIFYRNYSRMNSSWGPKQLVSEQSSDDAHSPDIVVKNSTSIHIVWHDYSNNLGSGSDSDIFYRKSSKYKWDSKQLISTESVNNSFTPSIAIDGRDNLHVAWKDRTDYDNADTDIDIFYKKYSSLAETWSATTVVSHNSYHTNSPAIVIDSSDNVHIVWEEFNHWLSFFEIRYSYFSTSTYSWSDPQVVSVEESADALRPSLTVDSGDNLHLVWLDYTNYNGAGTDADIFYRSKPNGEIWQNNTRVLSETSNQSVYPVVVGDYSGQVHVFWSDISNYQEAGKDADIFHKRFYGTPNSPTLQDISPNPNPGSVDLHWSEVYGAKKYRIYRSSQAIHSTNDLSPIGTTSSTYFVDNTINGGHYYYAVTGKNIVGEGKISNSVYVEVDLKETQNNQTVTTTVNVTQNSSHTTEENNEGVNTSESDLSSSFLPVIVILLTLPIIRGLSRLEKS